MEKTEMKNLLLTLALCAACVFGAYAATSVPVAGVVKLGANGDTVTSQLPYGATVVGVKVVPIGASKYYRLKNTDSAGGVIYETITGSTTNTLTLDRVRFNKPGGGLYFETNDTGASVYLYTE